MCIAVVMCVSLLSCAYRCCHVCIAVVMCVSLLSCVSLLTFVHRCCHVHIAVVMCVTLLSCAYRCCHEHSGNTFAGAAAMAETESKQKRKFPYFLTLK